MGKFQMPGVVYAIYFIGVYTDCFKTTMQHKIHNQTRICHPESFLYYPTLVHNVVYFLRVLHIDGYAARVVTKSILAASFN